MDTNDMNDTIDATTGSFDRAGDHTGETPPRYAGITASAVALPTAALLCTMTIWPTAEEPQ